MGIAALFIYGFLPAILVIIDLQLSAKHAKTIDQVMWILCTFFVPVIGLILYVFVGRKYMMRQSAVYDRASIENRAVVVAQQMSQDGQMQVVNQDLATNYYSQAPSLSTASKVMGITLSIIAVLFGLSVIGAIIMVAMTIYACSQPGAKCM